eukprot:GHVS01062723.1.p1 GENE.GHVS01062723.1~~GHVS01062723.1.p1  ORF type:complete len:702 (-),score=91.68 GHVS01062723.1:718-2823(-)
MAVPTSDGPSAGTASSSVEKIIKELWQKVKCSPGSFDGYNQLIKILKYMPERQNELREVYERLLCRFPMCYGYWIRLATLEGDNWAAAQETYECGMKFVESNPQFWCAYIEQAMKPKGEYEMAPQDIRAIIDRAISKCGRHWCSHGLWMCCINFEENQLRSIAEALTAENKQQAEQKNAGEGERSSIARLRHLYWGLLRIPHSKISASWEKFKVVLGQGRTESQTIRLDVTDLLVEQELEDFQTYVMEKLLKDKGAYGDRWRGSLQRADANKTYEKITHTVAQQQPTTSPSSTALSRRVTVRFPDGGTATFDVAAGLDLSELQRRCMAKGRGDCEEVDFLWKGQVVEKRTIVSDVEKSGSGAEEEELFLVLFDGEALAEVLQQVSGRAVEKWFLRKREGTYLKTVEACAVRSQFESQLRRTYFHPFPLSADQLSLWRQYLHYAKHNFDDDEVLLLHRRSVESCCSYPEFWSGYAEEWRRRGMADVARGIYKYATRVMATHSVEMHFLEAQFVESEGDVVEAEQLLSNVVSRCPQSIEAHLRLSSLRRRCGRLSDCEETLTKAMEGVEWAEEERGRMAVELGYSILREGRNSDRALKVVAGEWERCKSLCLFRFYVALMRRHSKGNFGKIVSLYEQGIHYQQYSLVSRWKLWKDYLSFVQQEARLRDVCKIKDRFADFLLGNAEALEKCRKRRRPIAPQPVP